MKKEQALTEKALRRTVIITAFIIVFLISYSYKFGEWFYTIIPWTFFLAMIISFGSIIGIMLFPLAMIYQTLFYGWFQFLPLAFTTLYSAIIIALICYHLFRGNEEIKIDTNFVLVMIIGFVAFLATVLNGVHVGFGNYELTHYFEAVLIFLVVTTFVSTKKRLRLFSWFLILGFAALAFRSYNHSVYYDMAIFGFENNDLGRRFAFFVPFMIGLFWAEKDKYLKTLIIIVVAFLVQGITQLGSRATYISVGIPLVFLGIKHFKKRSVWSFAVLGALFFIFFTGPQFYADLQSISYAKEGIESQEGSIQGRFFAMEMGWRLFKERPLFGYGVYPRDFNIIMEQRFNSKISGHNSYVILAVEMGIFGLIAYVLLFIISFLNSYRAQRIFKGKDDYLYYVANGTMFGTMAIAINQFMLNQPWIPIVLIQAALSSILLYLAKKKQEEPEIIKPISKT